MADELEYKIGFAKLLGTVVVDLISVGTNPFESVLFLPIKDKLRIVRFGFVVAVFWLQLLEKADDDGFFVPTLLSNL